MKYRSQIRIESDKISGLEDYYGISIEEFACRRNAERIIRDMSFDDLKKLFKFESHGFSLSGLTPTRIEQTSHVEYINSINIPE